MRDIVYVGLIVGFFALAGAYIQACAHLLGDEPT